MRNIINSIYAKLYRLCQHYRYKQFGKNSNIIFPLAIDGIENISIGNNVCIAYKTWLAAIPHTDKQTCNLIIGDGTCIGNFNHIYATESIIIEKNVLTADKVYISDNLHSYEDINTPIMHQPIKQISCVVIGEGSWIGENVSILGARIGKHCVIGSNSVVTKDIPDYSVAVGIPAKVIKYYSFDLKSWVFSSNIK